MLAHNTHTHTQTDAKLFFIPHPSHFAKLPSGSRALRLLIFCLVRQVTEYLCCVFACVCLLKVANTEISRDKVNKTIHPYVWSLDLFQAWRKWNRKSRWRQRRKWKIMRSWLKSDFSFRHFLVILWYHFDITVSLCFGKLLQHGGLQFSLINVKRRISIFGGNYIFRGE